MKLSALKSLKKPGAPPPKQKFHQKLLRSIQRVSHTILNGSSKALAKAVILLATVEVRPTRYVLSPTPLRAPPFVAPVPPAHRSAFWRNN